ncbi:MAG: hypothetical protein JXQ27_08590 [Acidobacteria bacterium]|nr:hypothetical protein [Acidobacteriota bacterium]
MTEPVERLTFGKITAFWLPLAATWLMMSLEGPFLAAVIARMVDPKFNLAAYGVAFSFALIIEAPIIMIMSAATALVRDRHSFIKMRNFTYALNGIITVGMLVGLWPPVFDFIAMDMIGLPPPVARLTHGASLLLLPWPAAIGFRRLYHGILIRHGRTRFVAYGTVIRLVSMAATGFGLYFLGSIAGAFVGAVALSVGVTVEALASRFMVAGIMRQLLAGSAEPTLGSRVLTYRYIAKFYYPLALTSILALGVHPMITFFVGKSRMAIESLAVLPVINSLSFIFRSVGLSFQEVAIALMGDRGEHYIRLRNFGTMLAGITVGALALLAFTPAAVIWFHDVSGLSSELTEFARLPLQLLVVMPGLTLLLSVQRAILVNTHHTSPVTTATGIEVGGILLLMFIGIYGLDLYGAVAATGALTVGRLVATGFLLFPCNRALRRLQSA